MIARLTSLILICHYFSGIFLQFPRPQDGGILQFLFILASTSAMAIRQMGISTLTKGYTRNVIATLKLPSYVSRMSLFHSWVTETPRYDMEPRVVMSYSSGLLIFPGLVFSWFGCAALFHRGAGVVDVPWRQYPYGVFPGVFTSTHDFLSSKRPFCLKFML